MTEAKRWSRTDGCGELRTEDIGERVVLNGWVHRRRDHGGLIFVDVRDRTGLVQVVFNEETSADAYTTADTLRNEYVVSIAGVVRRRVEGAENPELATGDI